MNLLGCSLVASELLFTKLPSLPAPTLLSSIWSAFKLSKNIPVPIQVQDFNGDATLLPNGGPLLICTSQRLCAFDVKQSNSAYGHSLELKWTVELNPSPRKIIFSTSRLVLCLSLNKLHLLSLSNNNHFLTAKNEITEILAATVLANQDILALKQDGTVALYQLRKQKLIKARDLCRITLERIEWAFLQLNHYNGILLAFYGLKNGNWMAAEIRDSESNQQYQTLRVQKQTLLCHMAHNPKTIQLVVVGINTYALCTSKEIYIVCNRFDSFFIMESFSTKQRHCKLRISMDFLTCHSPQGWVQIYQYHISQKLTTQLIDIVTLNHDNNFMSVQRLPHKPDLLLLFKSKDHSILSQTIRIDNIAPFQSLLRDAKSLTTKKGLCSLEVIGARKDITPFDFYYGLWKESPRNVHEVHLYLLPCQDIRIIRDQVASLIARRTIMIRELERIFEKLECLIEEKLKEHLDPKLLKDYIENRFILQKIRLKKSDESLDGDQVKELAQAYLPSFLAQVVREELFPGEPPKDPLHTMVEMRPPQNINLKHALQQFKVTLLASGFKSFLSEFMKAFPTAQELVAVFEAHPYLLPMGGFAVTSLNCNPQTVTKEQINRTLQDCPQPNWFKLITQSDLLRQTTLRKIQILLLENHPTSFILDTIGSLVSSSLHSQNFMRSHNLLPLPISDYQPAFDDSEGVKLHLLALQQLNVLDSTTNKHSQKLIKIISQHNHLSKDILNKLKLYSELHRFQLTHDFFDDGKTLTAEELFQMSRHGLIAQFFMQKKTRKKLLFSEFRSLFIELFSGEHEFNTFIQEFINSEVCSRVQIFLMLGECREKGSIFQVDNQNLLIILVEGLLHRITTEEVSQLTKLEQLMQDIQLNKTLGVLVTKAIQLGAASALLNAFSLQGYSFKQLIKLETNGEIFCICMTQFLQDRLTTKLVTLEDQIVSLQNCYGLLTALTYFRENIFYTVSQAQILEIYGLGLIEWRQFEFLKQFIDKSRDLLFSLTEISQVGYAEAIVRSALAELQLQSPEYNPQVKEHAHNIFEILQLDNPIRQYEEAKYALIDLIESWNVPVAPDEIQGLAELWRDPSNHSPTLSQIVDLYSDNLNLTSLTTLCDLLSRMTNCPFLEPTLIVHHTVQLATIILQKDRLSEVEQLIVYSLEAEGAQMMEDRDFCLLAGEALLKRILTLPNDPETISKAKALIAMFTLKQFGSTSYIDIIQHFDIFQCQSSNQSMTASSEFSCNPKEDKPLVFAFNDIWIAVQHQLCDNQSAEDKYFVFYFLLSFLNDPFNSSSYLQSHGDQLSNVTDTIIKVCELVKDSKEAQNIAFYFRKTLYTHALTQIDVLDTLALEKDEPKSDTLQGILEEEPKRYRDLLDSLQKVQGLLLKLSIKIDLEQNEAPKKINIQHRVSIDSEASQTEPLMLSYQRTLSFKELTRERLQISHRSAFTIGERDILEQIYQNLKIQKAQQSKEKKLNYSKGFFLPLLDKALKESEKIRQADDKLENLSLLSRQDLLNQMQHVWPRQQISFAYLYGLLRQVDAVSVDSIAFCEKAQQLRPESIPEADLKIVLPLPMITQDSKATEESKLRVVENIAEVIAAQSFAKGASYVKEMASFLQRLYDQSTIAPYYLISCLRYHGEAASLGKSSLIYLKRVMSLLASYPQCVSEHLSSLVEAFKADSELLSVFLEDLAGVFKDNPQLSSQIRSLE